MDEYRQNLPRKRMAVGLVLRNQEGKLLVLKPTYRDGWLIPGGVIETMESPLDALRRECQEELGIQLQGIRFLAVDYMDDPKNEDESIQFIFESEVRLGRLEPLRLSKEHSEYQLLPDKEALALVNPRLRRRLEQVLLHEHRGYLESSRISG